MREIVSLACAFLLSSLSGRCHGEKKVEPACIIKRCFDARRSPDLHPWSYRAAQRASSLTKSLYFACQVKTVLCDLFFLMSVRVTREEI